MVVKTIGAVSAFALLASVSGIALAQTPGGQGQEHMQGSQSTQQMAPGQQQSAPARRQGGGQAEAPQRGQSQAQQQQNGEQQKQQAQQPQNKQTKQNKQQKQAEQPQTKQQRQAEQPQTKQRRQAEQPQTRQQRQAEQPQTKQQRQAEQPQNRQQRQAESKSGRQQLSQQQRTTVRERISEGGGLDRARISSANFNISVGKKVPTRVKLVPLPSVIVQEVPAYRGYDYFVVRDEVVIVQPSTHVIVDVIRLNGPASQTAQLTLTGEQREIVLSHINMQPTVRLGIGTISVGSTLPQRVELHSFPAAVTSEVPKLRSYRYAVFENEVAIVSPDQRKVVLTINE